MLDFSGITDDQLVELVRACCKEALQRNPGISQAVHDVLIDEREKARIIQTATEAEIAAMRAKERQRIAEEAVRRVREQADAQTTEARRKAAAEKAAAAAEKEIARANERKNWLSRFANLTGQSAASISVWIASTNYGKRVLVNEGANQFARDHLADYNISTGIIKTSKALVRAKPALVALCVEFSTLYSTGGLCGADFDWSE